MNLYLVQHGEAKDEAEDPRRPLSEVGTRNVEKVAAFVSQNMQLNLGKIFHSGKARAEGTAQIMADYLKPTGGLEASDGLNPMDDPAIWAGRLKDMTANVMLVGHGPHLKKLASLLTCGDSEKDAIRLRFAGVFCLTADDLDDWAFQWILIPEMLG